MLTDQQAAEQVHSLAAHLHAKSSDMQLDSAARKRYRALSSLLKGCQMLLEAR